ncbi:MAG: ATP synthase F1 subunit delta [Candidatus Atribacteria bacterium]|nr:ATP synthase F1 subunit delta [Candidatus Atribacteria bacterium]
MGKVKESIEFKSNYYAQAVFNVARAENMVDQVEDELRQLKDEITNNLELKKNLTDPSIENYEKIKVMLEILGDDGSKAIKSFAAMMVILDAIDSFEQTYKDFVELANQLKRQVSIEVISVIELDKEILNEIKENVDKKTGLDVRIKNVLDKNIIGGLVIKIGDKVIDLSIKDKLEDLKNKLKALDLRGEDFGTEN